MVGGLFWTIGYCLVTPIGLDPSEMGNYLLHEWQPPRGVAGKGCHNILLERIQSVYLAQGQIALMEIRVSKYQLKYNTFEYSQISYKTWSPKISSPEVLNIYLQSIKTRDSAQKTNVCACHSDQSVLKTWSSMPIDHFTDLAILFWL